MSEGHVLPARLDPMPGDTVLVAEPMLVAEHPQGKCFMAVDDKGDLALIVKMSDGRVISELMDGTKFITLWAATVLNREAGAGIHITEANDVPLEGDVVEHPVEVPSADPRCIYCDVPKGRQHKAHCLTIIEGAKREWTS